MNKVAFCQIVAPYDVDKSIKCVQMVRPFVDGIIICCEDDSRKDEFGDVIFIKSNINDDFPAHRNEYLEKARELGYDYILQCDADEEFDALFLSSLKFILLTAPQYNGFDIRCEYHINNIELMDEDEIFRECPGGVGKNSHWWKLVLYSLEPTMTFTGGGDAKHKVHETLFKPNWKVLKLPPKYFMKQTKTAEEIWRNNARNVFICGGGNNVGDINNLHTIMRKYYSKWQDFYNAAVNAQLNPEILLSLIDHRNDSGDDYSSENKGAFKWYFKYLHPNVKYKDEYTPKTYTYSVEDIVKKKYFEILLRHPDLGGLTNYTDMIKNGLIKPEDLDRMLMQSDEYANTVIDMIFFDATGRAPTNKDKQFIKEYFKDKPEEIAKFTKHLATYSVIPSISYCQMTYKEDLHKTIENVKNAAKYVDVCIVVYDQTLGADDIKSLKDAGAYVVYSKWEDNFPKQRNRYLAEALSFGSRWVLVSDPDEHFDENFLKAIRFICAQAEQTNIDLLLINARDIFTDDENGNVLEKPNEVRGTYYKNLLFRLTPNTHYIGIGETKNLHEQLIGPMRPARLPEQFFYRHIKSHVEIWEHATRNVFVGGGGMNLGDSVPHYKEFKDIMNRLNLKTWREFRAYLIDGNIDNELKNFIIKHRNDVGHDYDSEYREMFKWYFQILHPEENVDKLTVDAREQPKEYTGVDKIVNDIYIKVLRREVDSDGLKHYGSMIKENKLKPEELEKILMNSSEYRMGLGT